MVTRENTKKKDDSIKRIGIMHLLGITFILYLLKLSAGNGFWKNKVCFSTILYNRISRRCSDVFGSWSPSKQDNLEFPRNVCCLSFLFYTVLTQITYI